VTPLPSASTFATIINDGTGFIYRGLSPHKFTPMPGVHQSVHLTGVSLRFAPADDFYVSGPANMTQAKESVMKHFLDIPY